MKNLTENLSVFILFIGAVIAAGATFGLFFGSFCKVFTWIANI